MSCSTGNVGTSSHCAPSTSGADAASGSTQSTALTATESLADSPTTEQRLSGSRTALEAATETLTLAQHVEEVPTPAEQLAQEPTTAERLACTPARPDLTGPIAGNFDMKPEADYHDGVDPEKFQGALEATAAHACQQWAAGAGVVGPMGSEQNFFFGKLNDPTHADYAIRQQFGFQHDLQATDAQLQDGTVANSYTGVNGTSAVQGFAILNTTKDVQQALEAARAEWERNGFEVRTRY